MPEKYLIRIIAEKFLNKFLTKRLKKVCVYEKYDLPLRHINKQIKFKQMKNVFNELIALYCEIFNRLESWEKAIFVFWSLCVIGFSIAYVRGLVAIIETYFFTKKSKPQKF